MLSKIVWDSGPGFLKMYAAAFAKIIWNPFWDLLGLAGIYLQSVCLILFVCGKETEHARTISDKTDLPT